MIENKNISRKDDFLDAVDGVLNSNTFLLRLSTNEIPDDLNEFLEKIIKSRKFKELMLEQDIDRKWFIYSSFNLDTKVWEPNKKDCDFFKSEFKLAIESISYKEFIDILVDMLTTEKSIYQKQLPINKAEEIVFRFIREIYHTSDLKTEGNNNSFYRIKPDFLNQRTELDIDNELDELDSKFYYFDGTEFDSCTLFIVDNNIYMLLTNGMP